MRLKSSQLFLGVRKMSNSETQTRKICSKCNEPAIYKLPNMHLCKKHFISYFETKVYKTIKKFNLIEQNDRICIATSGGKDSLAVLYTTMKYCKKYDIDFFALAIDEGIANYRDHTLRDLKKFCKEYKIKLNIISFEEYFGDKLDNITKKAMEKFNKKPCTVCGILRRFLLNKGAKDLKATKLVTGHNLDDESQAFMMNILLGNMSHNASLGPKSGLNKDKKFVTRIKPLYLVTEKETRLFAFVKNFEVHFSECPNIHHSFRAEVRDKLNDFENLRTGSKNGIVNSFLEILPELKTKYKKEKSFRKCIICGEPSSKDKCNTCKLIEELGLKNKNKNN